MLEADSAPEALAVLKQARGGVDLLVLDVVMPGCDGVELGRQILDQWPKQRILYMSAYPAEVVRRGLGDEVTFLLKPYTRDEALAKVHEALAARPDARSDKPEQQ